MKAGAETLGVARSHLHDKVHRLVKPREPYRKPDDDGLLEPVRRLIDARPTYCYRRITALTNRKRAKTGEPGEHNQAIGRSRDSRTTNIHALTYGLWRPVAFYARRRPGRGLQGGQALLGQVPETGLVNAEKGYDGNAIRRISARRASIPWSSIHRCAFGCRSDAGDMNTLTLWLIKTTALSPRVTSPTNTPCSQNRDKDKAGQHVQELSRAIAAVWRNTENLLDKVHQ